MKVNNTAPNINNKVANSKVAFTSKPIIDRRVLAKTFLNPGRGGDMSRGLFITNAFAFLLGGRLIKSRDKDEVRETLLRDVPTIVLAVIGVPIFGKWVTKEMQKHTGFALTETSKVDPAKEKWFNMPDFMKKIFKPKAEKIAVAGSDQLKDWYVYDDNLHSKFRGFVDRLKSNELNGNLKKIFSSLSKDIKERLKDFKGDNESIMKEFFPEGDIIKNEKTAKLKKDIIKAFSDNKNKAVEKARFMGAIPTIAGFAITLGLIGILIPKSNIYITEKINKKKAQKEKDLKEPKLIEASVAKAPSQLTQSKKTMENFAGKNPK